MPIKSKNPKVIIMKKTVEEFEKGNKIPKKKGK